MSDTPVEELSLAERELLEQIYADEVVAMLQKLVQQRSDYPPGDCSGIIAVVADKLKESAVSWQTFARQPHQINLLAAYPTDSRGPDLCFTLMPTPFQPERETAGGLTP